MAYPDRMLRPFRPANARPIRPGPCLARIAALGLALGSLRADSSATNAAGPAENPFKLISSRNAFGIRPPAPPPEETPPPPPPPPPSNVFLTGIARWGGKPTVYLQVNPQGSNTPNFLELEEGGAQDDIKVLEINEKAETVRIVNAGQEVILNFKDNGLKAAAAPAPQPGVAIPNRAPSAPNLPTPLPAANPGAGPTVIGRGGQLQSSPVGQAPVPIVPTVAPVYSGGNVSLPATGLAPGTEQPLRRSGVVGGAPISSRARTLPPPPPLPIDPALIPPSQ